MLAHRHEPSRVLTYLRLAANIVGTLFIAFVFLMNFTDLPENPPPVTTGDVIQLGSMIGVAIGVLLAWRWSLAGGLVMLLGFLGFEAGLFYEQGRMFGGLFLVIPVLALIHLFYWWGMREG